jgi:hypothetical protein
MAEATLRALHNYLKLIENPSELKRRMPASSNQRTMKEGLSEISKLAGTDSAAFKDPQNIAALIGSQRFTMIWGEPSVTTLVARIFEGSKALLTVLIGSEHSENAGVPSSGSKPAPAVQATTAKSLAAGWNQSGGESPPGRLPPGSEETAVLSLVPLIARNPALAGQLFRVLFEHMLAVASPANVPQESAALVNDFAGSKEHGRSFLATAMFILGAEIDRENLMAFMLEQRLFGMQLFDQLLQNRDYCAAYYVFRRRERAFVGSPTEEERQLRGRLDRFTHQFGGKPYDAKIFEADDQDKARVDSHLAAMDLLEILALTPLSMVLNNSVAAAPTHCVRSMKTIARHFERFAHGEQTREQTNLEIADHLVAFARQFSADSKMKSLS